MTNKYRLSEYEIKIAKLITYGYNAKTIAKHLGVSIDSVDFAIENIKRKLSRKRITLDKK